MVIAHFGKIGKKCFLFRGKSASPRQTILLWSYLDVSYFTHLSDNALIKNERRQLKLNVAQGKEDYDVMRRDLGENTHVLLFFVGWNSPRVLSFYWRDASPSSPYTSSHSS